MSQPTPNIRTHTSEYLEHLLNMCVGTMIMANEHSWDKHSEAIQHKHSEKCVQLWLQRLLLQQLNAAFPGENPQRSCDIPPCTVDTELPFSATAPTVHKKRADLVVTFPSKLTKAKSKAFLIEIKWDCVAGHNKQDRHSTHQAYFAIDEEPAKITTLLQWNRNRQSKGNWSNACTPKENDNMKSRFEEFSIFLDGVEHPVEAAGCFGIDFMMSTTDHERGAMETIDIHTYTTLRGTLTQHSIFQYHAVGSMGLNPAPHLDHTNDSINHMHQISKQEQQCIKKLVVYNHGTTHTWRDAGGWVNKRIALDYLKTHWECVNMEPLTPPIFSDFNSEVKWKNRFCDNIIQLCLWHLVYDTAVGQTNYGPFSNQFESMATLEPTIIRLQLLLQRYLGVLSSLDTPTGTSSPHHTPFFLLEILT
jgi:hypothetical protein